MPLIFDGNFNSGQIKTPANSGSGVPIIDTFFYSGMGPNGEPRGNDPRPENGSRLITDPVLSGTHAFRAEVDYTFDYRPFNSGTLQKPRTSLSVQHPNTIFQSGVEYWIGFAFLLPEDYIFDHVDNPDNLFQLSKMEDGTTGSYGKNTIQVSVVGDEIEINFRHPGGAANPPEDRVYFAAQKNKWHQIVFHMKLAKEGETGGFINCYANNSNTAIYTDTGPNTISSTHHCVINLYKYAWHATIEGPGYTGPASDARADYAFAMTNPNPTLDPGPKRFMVFDHVNVWSGPGGSRSAVSPAWDGSGVLPGIAGTTIIGMNIGQALTPNKSPVFFTTAGGDTRGVLSVTITDKNGVSDTAKSVNSDGAGGRFSVGNLDTLSAGSVAVSMQYATPVYDTQIPENLLTDWSLFAASVEPVDLGSDAYGYSQSAVVTNTETNLYGRITIPAAERPAASVGSEVTVKAVVYGPGTSGRADIRVAQGASEIRINGVLGSLSFTTPHGSGHSLSQEQVGDMYFITFKYTSTIDDLITLKIGADSLSMGDQITVAGARIWVEPSVSTITYSTTLAKPDTTAPMLYDAEILRTGAETATVGVQTDTDSGQVFVMVTDSLESSAPTQQEMKSGTLASGRVLRWISTPAGGVVNVAISTLDPTATWRAYVMQEDVAGNDSAVVQAPNDVQPVPAQTQKKIVFSASSGNPLYFYNTATKEYVPYSGTINLIVFETDWMVGNTSIRPEILVYASGLSVANGELVVYESNASVGSINALATGDQGYFMTASTANGAIRWDNAIEVEEV